MVYTHVDTRVCAFCANEITSLAGTPSHPPVRAPLQHMALQVLYANAAEGIAVYHRSAGGGLTLHTGASAAPGGTFCVSPNRGFMFVASDGHFRTHPIDPQTGGLGDAVAGAAFTDGPAYMATDRSGRFLLHASYGACRARICLWEFIGVRHCSS